MATIFSIYIYGFHSCFLVSKVAWGNISLNESTISEISHFLVIDSCELSMLFIYLSISLQAKILRSLLRYSTSNRKCSDSKLSSSSLIGFLWCRIVNSWICNILNSRISSSSVSFIPACSKLATTNRSCIHSVSRLKIFILS